MPTPDARPTPTAQPGPTLCRATARFDLMHPAPTTAPSAAPARARRRLGLLAPWIVLALALTILALVPDPSPAVPQTERRAAETGLLTPTAPKARVEARSGRSREVGMRFTPRVDGTAVGVRFFKPLRWKASTPRSATLWTLDGRRLARVSVAPVADTGWRRATFASPVRLSAGTPYVVSVHTRAKGVHAVTPGGFAEGRRTPQLRAPGGRNGLTALGDRSTFPEQPARRDANYWVDVRFVADSGSTTGTTPTGTPTPTPTASSWPGPDNTGVPAGTSLTPYGGPCTISAPTTIVGVDATRCDALVIQTKGVVIERSLLPRVQSIWQDGGSSVSITDSEVRGGETSIGAVWGYNITALRVEVTGGQHSFHCNSDCEVVDSWLHDQYNPASESFHNNAFISNGGENMVIRHNTLHCTTTLNRNDGGCTADLSLFGDFEPIDNVVVANNYLRANSSSISYCAYGGGTSSKPHQATNVRFTDNVFERGTNRKCGVYGPVTDFDRRAAGNVWSGNTWDTGGSVG